MDSGVDEALGAQDDELDHAIEAIGSSPETWPVYREGTRRYLFRRFPFFVVYRVEGEEIHVIAIAHAHRRPGYWKDR